MAMKDYSELCRTQRYRRKKKAKELGVDASQLIDMRGKHQNHAKGSRSGKWNDGRIISSHGYVKIRVGLEHPLADPNGYAYEHLLVWVSAGRNAPGADELLHHDNEDKQDNRLRNLILKLRSRHGTEHIALRSRDSLGRLLAT
jgi:hypothetical protein